MLIETFGDPSLPSIDPLPEDWKDLEAESQEGKFGISSFWKEYLPRHFSVIRAWHLYRSAIPWTHQIEELSTGYNLKNIVSLIDWDWLDPDMLNDMGIVQHKFNILQRRALTKEKVRVIVEYIQSLEGPTLVHCLKWAIRTGQVIAWYQLWVEWKSKSQVLAHGICHRLINASALREISQY